MIRFQCPHCSTNLSAPDNAAGRLSGCTKCQQRITVPGGATVPAANSDLGSPPPLDELSEIPQTDNQAILGVLRGIRAGVWTIAGILIGLAILSLIAVSMSLSQPRPRF